jgi:hypothetical protein
MICHKDGGLFVESTTPPQKSYVKRSDYGTTPTPERDATPRSRAARAQRGRGPNTTHTQGTRRSAASCSTHGRRTASAAWPLGQRLRRQAPREHARPHGQRVRRFA